MARRGLLTQTAEPAKEVLGVETIEVVADKGYFKIEDIEACEKAGIVPYVPRPQRGPSVKAGLFRKDEFQYDADTDSFVCPAGQRLGSEFLTFAPRRSPMPDPFRQIRASRYRAPTIARDPPDRRRGGE
jgi:hypothetical protein